MHGFGGVQAPFGLGTELDAALAAMPPPLAGEVRQLIDALLSFQTVSIQARAFVPVIR